jgi:hypothetical protein
MVNSSAATFGDGVTSADVKDFADYQDANLVVRYQDSTNYYLIQAYASTIVIYKKVAGVYQFKASAGISPDFNGGVLPPAGNRYRRDIHRLLDGRAGTDLDRSYPLALRKSGCAAVRGAEHPLG